MMTKQAILQRSHVHRDSQRPECGDPYLPHLLAPPGKIATGIFFIITDLLMR